MRYAVRHGLAFGLLWLACGSNIILAQAAADSSNINNNNNNEIPRHSHDNTTLLITTNSTTSVTAESRLPATCRSGTVNHITHTLPQLCPTSSLITPGSSSANGTATTSSSITSSSGSGDAPPTSSNTEPLPDESAAQNATQSQSLVPSDSATSASQAESYTESASSSSSPATAAPEPASTDAEAELETDSPLDNANFLSFEEWKKQNLEKAGQSPDGGQHGSIHDRTRPDIALDALGDEGEISLDFAGFGSGNRPEDANKNKEKRNAPSKTDNGVSAHAPILRSKDAGKTCKERSNYASFDCAASVLKTNPEAKSTNAVLIENKDSYMLNPCSASNKFIIVELCNDILIDTLVLANYEFFSSIFRTFRVSVSDRYPVKADKWKELGVFEASNSRSVQAFLIEQPLIWARYLRVEFLTHFGTEYYCPLSLLRVHGTTMLEEYRHHEQLNRGEQVDDGDDDAEIVEGGGGAAFSGNDEKIAQEPETVSAEADKSVVEEAVPTIDLPVESVADHAQDSTATLSSAAESSHIQNEASSATSNQTSFSESMPTGSSSTRTHIVAGETRQEVTVSSTSKTTSTPTGQQMSPAGSTLLEKASNVLSDASATIMGKSESSHADSPRSTSESAPASPDAAPSNASTLRSASTRNGKDTSQEANTTPTPLSESSKAASSGNSSTAQTEASSAISSSSVSAISSNSTVSSPQHSSSSQTTQSSAPTQASASQPPSQGQHQQQHQQQQNQSQQVRPSASHPSQQHQHHNNQKPPSSSSSSISAPHPSPTTQESFFKSISTRLRALESNATLSLQYIESQSLLLRTAFAAVEKRQLSKTTTFLSSLNQSVTAELEGFKRDYERLWEGVVIELESQRSGSERELELVLGRLRAVAEELVWQKRVALAQTFLILLCLGLVMFARSGVAGGVGVAGVGGLDVGLLQQLQIAAGRGKWRARSPEMDDGGYRGDRSPVSPVSPVLGSVEAEGFGSPGSEGIRSEDGGEGKVDAWSLRRRRGGWRGGGDSGSRRRRQQQSGNVSESTTEGGGRPFSRDGEGGRSGVASATGSVVVGGGRGSSNGSAAGSRRKVENALPELRFQSATPTGGTPLKQKKGGSSTSLNGVTDDSEVGEEGEGIEEEEEGGDAEDDANVDFLSIEEMSAEEEGQGPTTHSIHPNTSQGRSKTLDFAPTTATTDAPEELDSEISEEDEDAGMVVPKETRSSPSTPGGTRDVRGILGVVNDLDVAAAWDGEGDMVGEGVVGTGLLL